jgi:hypothetical protein
LVLYPNPTDGKISIEIPKGNTNSAKQVSIYNALGSLIWQQNTRSEFLNLDFGNYPKGIYLINVLNDDKIQTGKFILR